jgi:hypothetical protein
MSYDLANKYAEFEIPKELKQVALSKQLSLSATKMVLFSDHVQLNNDDVDYYMALKPERMEDESFVDYKNRRVFTKQLFKKRSLIYDYSVYERIIKSN